MGFFLIKQTLEIMQKFFLASAALLAGFGVMIGAFGAHALKALLEHANRVETFETAVKYQFYHALGLMLIALLMDKFPTGTLNHAAWAMFGGTIIFSGSLYIRCLTEITKFGMITPIGGVLLVASWLLLALRVIKHL